MGVLRFLLATAVATNHSGCAFGYCLFPGGMAVQIFFMISGFLMGLILNEKYLAGQTWLFYSNRALRIYVPYLFVWLAAFAAAFLILGLSGMTPLYALHLFTHWKDLDLPAAVIVGFTNLAIIGQDVGLWLAFDGSLYWTQEFWTQRVQLQALQLLPQAWSLALELMFYALVPLIARRTIAVPLALFAFCIFLRMASYSFGFEREPWSTRFFPFELAFFVAGLISYRLFAATRSWPIWDRRISIAVMVCVVFSVIDYYAFTEMVVRPAWVYLGAMALSLPFLFLATKGNRYDSWIGDLSYPIYLIHWPVLGTVNLFWPAEYAAVATVGITIVLSIIFVQVVDRSLDRLRQARFRRSQAKMITDFSSFPSPQSESERHDAAKTL